MKAFIRTTALAAIFAGLTFAQGPLRPRGSGGTPPDPATMIAHQVERLTTLLDLTSAQASQITTILTNAQSASSSIRASLDTNHTSLETAVTSNNTATIDQVTAAIGMLQGQLLGVHSKAEAAVYALLTSTQQTKLSTLGGVGLLGGGGGPGRGFGGPPHP